MISPSLNSAGGRHALVDPLLIPDFCRLTEEERAAGRARSVDVQMSESRPTRGLLSETEIRRHRENGRRAAEQERAAAKRRERDAPPEEVLVYRTGRHKFVRRTAVRRGEEFISAGDLKSVTSPAEPASSKPARPLGKRAERRLKMSASDRIIVDLLRRPRGATADELAAAAGCKPHSCTCRFAGYRRGGVLVNAEKIAGRGMVYRIEE